ncbi:Putative peroxiredoxin bcp [Rubripirellula lacrimiformis]|uniref:thioredoxin-dependent peroxiredoxin n=1 Tax=Rubripirellula lacrimiformis TaxID=1930273 RepID=A0A517N4B7_9BACT|nr:peroxiredoxin-like family protein [Rubripirellula lacrimiformis]QDT01981.1 Putative peroxiredoxin bcp [Rubripirellula lacrimiformis]
MKPSLHLAIAAFSASTFLSNVAMSQESKPAMTMSQQLAEKAAQSINRMPADRLAAAKKGVEMVRATGIEESAKQVGDAAVDGQLKDWKGNTITLSELWNEGPIVLMWYRGGWCPYCNIQLRAMQQNLDKIENAGAKLVILTPELPEKAKQTAEANDLNIVALHDKNNELAKKYGIVFDLPSTIAPMYRDSGRLKTYNGNDDLQLPLSATYVVDKSGKITYAFLDADYKKRAEPAEVIAAVKAIAAD